MPDIFGREAHDYTLVRDLQEAGQWDAYQRSQAQRRNASVPRHDFNALGSGVPNEYHRSGDDAQAIGFLTNNMLAIQTMVDEVLYTAYRLPMFVSLDMSVPEGAQSYGIRVRDHTGRAERVTGPGYDAPSATSSEDIETIPMHYYGLDATWAIDELRGAMMAGHALDTESIEAAVTGSLKTMEAVGLTGGGYTGATGLLNLDAAASPTGDQVNLSTQGASMTFSDVMPVDIRNLINGEISAIISGSMETLGRNINQGMTVYLPGEQYDLLTTRYIGDNAENTLLRSIKRDNPWTEFAGTPLNVERVIELEGRGVGTNVDRMVVALKHPRVAKMAVSIEPRVLSIKDKGRVICAQVESKFSELFLLRPIGVRYTDAI